MLCNYENIAKFKILQNKVKCQGEGHQVNIVVKSEKVLSQATHMSNMKALCQTVEIEVKEKVEENLNIKL
jgi:hypothetical protein